MKNPIEDGASARVRGCAPGVYSQEITTIRDREHEQPGNMLYLVGEMENTQDNKDLGGAELFTTALPLRTARLFIKLMFVRG